MNSLLATHLVIFIVSFLYIVLLSVKFSRKMLKEHNHYEPVMFFSMETIRLLLICAIPVVNMIMLLVCLFLEDSMYEGTKERLGVKDKI